MVSRIAGQCQSAIDMAGAAVNVEAAVHSAHKDHSGSEGQGDRLRGRSVSCVSPKRNLGNNSGNSLYCRFPGLLFRQIRSLTGLGLCCYCLLPLSRLLGNGGLDGRQRPVDLRVVLVELLPQDLVRGRPLV